MSQFQAVYTGTEETVPGLTADSAGEILTGVGRDVFERSAFVGQSAMAVTGSAELERRIYAIVSSGQEDVSFSETERRLRDWKNRRQSNQKNGLIPRLEEEKAKAAAALEHPGGSQPAGRPMPGRRSAPWRRSGPSWNDRPRPIAPWQAPGSERAMTRLEPSLRKPRPPWTRCAGNGGAGALPPMTGLYMKYRAELSYLNTLNANINKRAGVCGSGTALPGYQTSRLFRHGARRRTGTAEADVRAADKYRKRKIPLPAYLLAAVILLLTSAGALLIRLYTTGSAVLYGCLAATGAAALCAVVICCFLRHRRNTARTAKLLASYGVQEAQEILTQAEAYIAQWEAASQARTDAAVRAVSLERMEAEPGKS